MLPNTGQLFAGEGGQAWEQVAGGQGRGGGGGVGAGGEGGWVDGGVGGRALEAGFILEF